MTTRFKRRIRRHKRQRKFRTLLFTTVIVVGIAIGAIIPSISNDPSDINSPAQTSDQPIKTSGEDRNQSDVP